MESLTLHLQTFNLRCSLTREYLCVRFYETIKVRTHISVCDPSNRVSSVTLVYIHIAVH